MCKFTLLFYALFAHFTLTLPMLETSKYFHTETQKKTVDLCEAYYF